MSDVGLISGWIAQVAAGKFSAIPAGLTYDRSAELAHLIDGYDMAGQLGADDYNDFYLEKMSGKRTYIITTSRMTSGDELKQRKGKGGLAREGRLMHRG